MKRKREGDSSRERDRQANRQKEGLRGRTKGMEKEELDSSIMQFLGCFSFWKFTGDLNFKECVFSIIMTHEGTHLEP